MTSSPSDGCYTFDSPENKDGKPLYHSTDNFLPLGYSTPQHHRNSGHTSSQSRNYYSAQPKYMLPRQRGFHNRNRNHQQQHQHERQQQQQQQKQDYSRSPAESDDRPTEKRNYPNREWRNRNFNHRSNNNRYQQHPQQFQRRNRFGLGHSQNKDNGGKYNIDDYFHPSMLEDPWLQLVQQNDRNKTEEGDSNDADGVAGGSGSDVGED